MIRFRSVSSVGIWGGALIVLLVAVSGCGTSRTQTIFNEGFSAAPNVGIEVDQISNTGKWIIEFDYQTYFKEYMDKELKKRKLLWEPGKHPKLVFSAKIIEYTPGNAAVRWVAPGSSGATTLEIEGVYMLEDREVGNCRTYRSIVAGGVYTVGAWKSIFQKVAKDIVKDLEESLPQEP